MAAGEQGRVDGEDKCSQERLYCHIFSIACVHPFSLYLLHLYLRHVTRRQCVV